MPTSFFISPTRATPLEFYPNDIILDRYMVLKRNEQSNGHAGIYFCQDTWDYSPCVLKELSNAVADKSHAFHLEIKRLILLPFHRNTVRLLRMEIMGDTCFAVQEWLPYTLRDRMAEKLSVGEILNVGLSICAGMMHCSKWLSPEDGAFVHGDLKPENIFIDEDGIVKIADFGGGLTRGYAAPEAIADKNADTRSDIFSTGVILKELCGDIPGTSAIKEIALYCRKDNPADRPQSWDVLFDALVSAYGDIVGGPCPLEMSVGDISLESQLGQYCDLALIGEFSDLPQKLFSSVVDVDCLSAGRLLNRGGDIALYYGRPQDALILYDEALNKEGPHRSATLAGKAEALFCMNNFAAAEQTSMAALTFDIFSYRAVRVCIEIYKYTENNLGLKQVLSFIYELRNHQPLRKELLKLSGYIHCLLAQYHEAAECYGECVHQMKSDYESMYYYALSLYMTFETTQAQEYFHSCIETIQTLEPKGHHESQIILGKCYYFLNSMNKAFDCFFNYSPTLSFSGENKTILDMIYNDCYLKTCPFHSFVLNFEKWTLDNHRLPVSLEMYAEILEYLKEYQDEWTKLSLNTDISPEIRYLNFSSSINLASLHAKMFRTDAALEAINYALRWDHSSVMALHNKAEILVLIKEHWRAIPLFNRYLTLETDVKRSSVVWYRLSDIKDKLYNNNKALESFVSFMLELSSECGSKYAFFHTLLTDFIFMFDSRLYRYLSELTEQTVDRMSKDRVPDTEFRPIIEFAAGLQQVDSEIKEQILELSIRILDVLIEKLDGIPPYSTIAYESIYMRALAYQKRIAGDPCGNIEKGIADIEFLLHQTDYAAGISPDATAGMLVNYANLYSLRKKEERGENLRKAEVAYQHALSLAADGGLRAQICYNYALCLYLQKRYEDSGLYANEALRYFQAYSNPRGFAMANRIIANIRTEYFLNGMINDMLVDKMMLSYMNTLLYFTKESHPDDYRELVLNLSNILRARQIKYHDGSGTLAQYYLREAKSCMVIKQEKDSFTNFLEKETKWLTPLSFDLE